MTVEGASCVIRRNVFHGMWPTEVSGHFDCIYIKNLLNVRREFWADIFHLQVENMIQDILYNSLTQFLINYYNAALIGLKMDGNEERCPLSPIGGSLMYHLL